MSKKSSSGESSDRESWDKFFKTLVKILQTKQDEIESLLKERKALEDKLKSQHENWISDVRNYEQQLSLMNRETETTKKMQFFETSKCNLLSGLKDMDRSLCDLKLEETVDESNDFKAWFDFLTLNTNKESGNSLEAEVRRLKLEYEKLASEKKCEVSDLSRENGFVWSQLRCIESGFTDKLKKKEDEISQANAKISSLLSYQEQIQSSNHEKDEIISSLKAKVAETETSSRKKNEEISKLSRELESLKKSRSFTPVLTRCTTRDQGNTVGSHVSTKKEKLAASTSSQEEIKSSKRKRGNKTTPATVSVIPKLFTSTFRLPKLKSPPSGAI
ncbi:hypothetical protein Bca52824_012883 [Brassica carinata]|uniref:Uncharacterized protein n=1 Tax=Brassica carinata TaxID=52824 RepID=A0A8X7VZ95_BRACI|nr:hypothetical protein Bca52824_012883 [Brassica carinata]